MHFTIKKEIFIIVNISIKWQLEYKNNKDYI